MHQHMLNKMISKKKVHTFCHPTNPALDSLVADPMDWPGIRFRLIVMHLLTRGWFPAHAGLRTTPEHSATNIRTESLM